MTHPAAAYWNRGVRRVPTQTGASQLLDARDVPEIAGRLKVPLPFGIVLDVGCGTGRVAKHCDTYHGVDIAADAVAYCRKRGLSADVIDGPASLETYADRQQFDLVLAMSVFTHIDDVERSAYLAAFRRIAPAAIIDIILGDGGGDVALWTCDPFVFADAADEAGWSVTRHYDKPSPEGVPHRYYLLETKP